MAKSAKITKREIPTWQTDIVEELMAVKTACIQRLSDASPEPLEAMTPPADGDPLLDDISNPVSGAGILASDHAMFELFARHYANYAARPTGNTVFVWGGNLNGELGVPFNRVSARRSPTPMTGLDSKCVVDITTGFGHTFVVLGASQLHLQFSGDVLCNKKPESGDVYACGGNWNAQIETGFVRNSIDSLKMVKGLSGLHVVKIACGFLHVIALIGANRKDMRGGDISFDLTYRKWKSVWMGR